MSAEIITVGDELLTGEAVNTNAAYLAKKLQELGIDLCYQTSVGDDGLRLKKVFTQALSRSSIIVITGGLGPTKDDITKEVIAGVLERKMVVHKPTFMKIQNRLNKGRMNVTKSIQKVALCPEGAEILDNPVGTAPGIILTEGEKKIILMPGVPGELKSIVEQQLAPYLMRFREKNYMVKQQILKVWGLPESKVGDLLEDLMGESRNPLVGLRTKTDGIEISIIAKGGSPTSAGRLIERTEQKIKERLGDCVYATGDVSMEKVVGMLLSINKKTIAIAESITGGLISKKITDIPGSSQYFLEAVVSYSNDSKIRNLKVPQEVIKKHGAVSAQVCKAMATEIKSLSSADIGLATTGIAGPSGGTRTKPVGLTFIGLATENGYMVENYRFVGTRLTIRTRAAQAGLDMVRRYLIGVSNR